MLSLSNLNIVVKSNLEYCPIWTVVVSDGDICKNKFPWLLSDKIWMTIYSPWRSDCSHVQSQINNRKNNFLFIYVLFI